MIRVKYLSFSYNSHPILSNVSVVIAPNTKVGLVGPNGAGKTTFLRLLTQQVDPDAGVIDVHGTLGYVPQEVKNDPVLENSTTIRSYLGPNAGYHDRALQSYLSGLELDFLNLDNSPKVLSGGQKTKLALARALLLHPDTLLLDEPTNYLDVAGKRWVMDFLGNYDKSVIIISHDLSLLDAHIQKVFALNPVSKSIDEYKGNYSAYLHLKEEREAYMKRQIVKQHKQVERMTESLHKMKRNKSASGVRQRTLLRHRMEQLRENLPELPKEAQSIGKIRLPEPIRGSEISLKATAVSKSYTGSDIPVLDHVSLTLLRGERIALIGPNGAGKSTLLKILVGSLAPDSGEVFRDDKLSLGYYSQEHDLFDLEETVLTMFQQHVSLSSYAARSILGKFLISGNKVEQTIGTLSGGEKTRLAIAMLIAKANNVLILDEPTTYLDVMSQRIILEALKEYTGSMIVVSHTEQFIAELKPDKYLLLPENKFDFWRDKILETVNEV